MGTIDHHLFLSFGFPKLFLCFLNAFCIVVRARLPTTEDDEAVLVSGRANNCHDSRLGDRQEMVGALSTAHRCYQLSSLARFPRGKEDKKTLTLQSHQ